MEYFLCVIGMVMFIEGFPYAAFPDKLKLWTSKMLELSPATLRGLGLVLMLTGLLAVYAGKMTR